MKLSDAFALKKLEMVEAVWPDGSRLPLRVYGALTPGRWYFLGMSPTGRLRMRGSGWRFFRFDTFALLTPTPTSSVAVLPTLRCLWS